MKVGVPSEIKNHEYRVALTPAGVHELTRAGHEVFVQKGAGEGSSLDDDAYVAAGATIIPDPDEVWGAADMILKVKEPIAEEYHRMRPGLPLLAPMSEVAGRLAPQVGAYHLMRQGGGYGALLGGVPGTHASKVVVIGGGVCGPKAAQIAGGAGADVN